MKIKQRKNYIHLVVSGVPLFSTLETLQEEEWIRGGGEEEEEEEGLRVENGFALVSFSFSPLHQRARQGLYSDNRAILSSWLLLSVFPPLIISRVSHAGGKGEEKKKEEEEITRVAAVFQRFSSILNRTRSKRGRGEEARFIPMVATKRCIAKAFFSRTLRKQF